MDKTNAQKLILENLSKMGNLKTSLKSSTIKIKITDYSNSRNSLVRVDSEMEVNLDDTVQKVKEDYKKLGESTNAMKHYPLEYIRFSSNDGDELESGKKVRDYKELLERDNNIYIPRNDLGLHHYSLSKMGNLKTSLNSSNVKKKRSTLRRNRKRRSSSSSISSISLSSRSSGGRKGSTRKKYNKKGKN